MRQTKRSTLIKNLDAIFSKYIRTRYSKNGMVECVTCKRQYEISKIQNGHFISRKHYATRWDEENVAPQCYGCNVMKYGEQFLFSKWIEQTYGEGKADELLQRSREVVKFSDYELKEMIELYKQKYMQLETR